MCEQPLPAFMGYDCTENWCITVIYKNKTYSSILSIEIGSCIIHEIASYIIEYDIKITKSDT